MSDPKKIKLTGKLVLKAKLNETGEVRNFYHQIDDKYKNIPPEQVEEAAKQDLTRITDKTNTTIYGMVTSFSYAEKDVLKDFDFGNVLVEANLPYCFHIPNFVDLAVSIPELNFKALITPEKIWTNRAQEEGVKSDQLDYYAEDTQLHFNKSSMIGPRLPIESELGWEHFITGKNIEKIKDKNGTFRYTKVYIQLNLDLPKDIKNLSSASQKKLFKEVTEKSLLGINRLIDNYRDITNETHVRRLGRISVNFIYFIPQDIGFYLSDFNITSAMINRSRKEINELYSRLDKGEKPEVYKLLLLNPQNSFESNDYTMAIVESFQSLEIFLENYLISEFKKRGDKETDYKKILGKYWTTKQRLNDVLNQIKKVKLNQQTAIWDKWSLHYDKTRNEVIHAGREPIENETKEMLEINEKVIAWVLTL